MRRLIPFVAAAAAVAITTAYIDLIAGRAQIANMVTGVTAGFG